MALCDRATAHISRAGACALRDAHGPKGARSERPARSPRERGGGGGAQLPRSD